MKGGEGYVFPIFDLSIRGLGACDAFCTISLLYFFLGVSIIADLFMEAIEVITSKSRVIELVTAEVEKYGTQPSQT